MKLTKTCARFLRKHGGTLLAIGASVGVVLTAIETGKATIKAEKLVELNKDVPEYDMKEKVKDCWQFYIPAAVLGAGTIGCIIGSNMLSRKEIASLSAAYVALGKSYQQYRRQVAERIGTEEEEKLRMDMVKEQKYLHDGVLAMLHDRLYLICTHYIKMGYIDTDGLDNVGVIYRAYHGLKGNGTGTNLYKRVCALPIKEGDEPLPELP